MRDVGYEMVDVVILGGWSFLGDVEVFLFGKAVVSDSEDF